MTSTTLPASIANLTQARKYLTCAETAKLIRKALKEAFPEVKFGVRSHTYAGGASINVVWIDGPLTSQVEKIAKLFSGASFDGMQDLKTSNTHALDGQPVRFGADYVSTRRDWSEHARANMITAVSRLTESEREVLLIKLRLSGHYRATDRVEELARVIFNAMPAPAFEGRRSALAETITDITLN